MREDAEWIYYETYAERKAAAPLTHADQYKADNYWWWVPVGSTHIPESLEVRRRKPPESQHFL
jgi:hypothetical protein